MLQGVVQAAYSTKHHPSAFVLVLRARGAGTVQEKIY